MKEGIHPEYNQTKIHCVCGSVVETGSVKKNISVEICSNCHPFFTGETRLIDTAGKIEKFNLKYGRKTKGA
ncbi:MAG: 50S ribosomal protein L31 [Deltaproteobacteria bacterium]|nr:50S ribosomal protein L31 [Deltaproteobacteria bacterium]